MELYQQECFEVLYDYWHKGKAVNPRAKARFNPEKMLSSIAEELLRKNLATQDETETLRKKIITLQDRIISLQDERLAQLTSA